MKRNITSSLPGMAHHIVSDDKIQKVTLETKYADTAQPTIDVNMITVGAEPVNPNGEMFVTVEYYVKDALSGFEKGLSLSETRWGVNEDMVSRDHTHIAGHVKSIFKRIQLFIGNIRVLSTCRKAVFPVFGGLLEYRLLIKQGMSSIMILLKSRALK